MYQFPIQFVSILSHTFSKFLSFFFYSSAQPNVFMLQSIFFQIFLYILSIAIFSILSFIFHSFGIWIYKLFCLQPTVSTHSKCIVSVRAEFFWIYSVFNNCFTIVVTINAFFCESSRELHLQIANSASDVAAALIQMAPHPCLLDTANDDALTPLHIAVLRRLSGIARLLVVAGAKPGLRNSTGDSPLHIAAEQGDLDCCKAILYPIQLQEREQLSLMHNAQHYTAYNIEQWNHAG